MRAKRIMLYTIPKRWRTIRGISRDGFRTARSRDQSDQADFQGSVVNRSVLIGTSRSREHLAEHGLIAASHGPPVRSRTDLIYLESLKRSPSVSPSDSKLLDITPLSGIIDEHSRGRDLVNGTWFVPIWGNISLSAEWSSLWRWWISRNVGNFWWIKNSARVWWIEKRPRKNVSSFSF